MNLWPNRDREAPAALARLADGNATDAERAQLEAAVARSPELAAALAAQRRALALVAALDVEAPAELHARVRALAQPPVRRQPHRRVAARTALVAALAVVILVAALARSQSQPDVHSVLGLTLSAATQPAPAVNARDHATLDVAVNRTVFPNWRSRGWHTTGARLDNLDGHVVETVYYTAEGYERVGYSIVGGAALRVGGWQRTITQRGVRYWVIDSRGASVLTWRRDGHTCVLASRRVPVQALLALAQAD